LILRHFDDGILTELVIKRPVRSEVISIVQRVRIWKKTAMGYSEHQFQQSAEGKPPKKPALIRASGDEGLREDMGTF
jgi:hypothetical protein